MTSGNQWDRMGSSRSSCWANCIITHLLETLRWDDKQQSQSLDQLLENGKYPKQHSKINQLCLKYEISVSPLCKLEVEVLNVKEINTIRCIPEASVNPYILSMLLSQESQELNRLDLDPARRECAIGFLSASAPVQRSWLVQCCWT